MRMAMAYIPAQAAVLDVGSLQGELLLKIQHQISFGLGIDPLIEPAQLTPKIKLVKGYFPQALTEHRQFDAICALAVLEHIPATEPVAFMTACHTHLRPGGRLIITVPHPRVDTIMAVMTRLKLAHGMSLEEHYGFESSTTPHIAAKGGLSLLVHKKFQLGLNNLFVFEK